MDKLRGEYGWVALTGGIIAYDIWAMKTKKAETLSSAVWRSLEHPAKYPLLFGSWAILTHHLFLNKQARSSLAVAVDTLKTILTPGDNPDE